MQVMQVVGRGGGHLLGRVAADAVVALLREQRAGVGLHPVAAPGVGRDVRAVGIGLRVDGSPAVVIAAAPQVEEAGADRRGDVRRRAGQRGVVQQVARVAGIEGRHVPLREHRRLGVMRVDVAAVGGVAGGGEQLDRREQAQLRPARVVGLLLARAQAAGAAGGIVVVEEDVGIGQRPGPGALGAREQVRGVRLHGRVVEAAEDLGRLRVGRGRRERGGRAGVAVVARPRGRRRRAAIGQPHDRQHRAITVLHARQPVRAPLHLVEQVGNAVVGLGQIEVVGPDRWILDVGVQQVLDVAGGPTGVLVGITRIEPAAAQVTRRAGVVGIEEAPCLRVLSALEMAGPVGPAHAGVGHGLLLTGALVIEHPHGLDQHVAVDVLADLETRRALVGGGIDDLVGAGRGDLAEVEVPHLVARGVVGLEPVPVLRPRGVHDGAGRRVDHLQLLGPVALVAVEADLGQAQHGHLLHAGQIAELVDHDELAGIGGHGWPHREVEGLRGLGPAAVGVGRRGGAGRGELERLLAGRARGAAAAPRPVAGHRLRSEHHLRPRVQRGGGLRHPGRRAVDVEIRRDRARLTVLRPGGRADNDRCQQQSLSSCHVVPSWISARMSARTGAPARRGTTLARVSRQVWIGLTNTSIGSFGITS